MARTTSVRARAGYAIVNLGASYRLTPWMQLIAQINNLFDRRYYTAAQLGPLGFTDTGTSSRGLCPRSTESSRPPVDVLRARRPMRMWVGARFKF